MTFPNVAIFASGAATRAASYSNGLSKCLLPLPDGEAVLDKIMASLAVAGAHTVTLLTTYDANGIQVQEYARTHQIIPNLRFVGEPVLGGTISALRAYCDAFGSLGPTLLLNHDTLISGIDLRDFVRTYHHLDAEALEARATVSGISSGVRLISARILRVLASSTAARNIEDALTAALIYPVPDDAFVDVGTLTGYERAYRLYEPVVV